MFSDEAYMFYLILAMLFVAFFQASLDRARADRSWEELNEWIVSHPGVYHQIGLKLCVKALESTEFALIPSRIPPLSFILSHERYLERRKIIRELIDEMSSHVTGEIRDEMWG